MDDAHPTPGTDAPQATPQRRAAARQRVFKGARVMLDDRSTLSCTLKDLSDTGAKIRIDNVAGLPPTFRLHFVQENLVREVQVVWKTQNTLGVTFCGPARPHVLKHT